MEARFSWKKDYHIDLIRLGQRHRRQLHPTDVATAVHGKNNTVAATAAAATLANDFALPAET